MMRRSILTFALLVLCPSLHAAQNVVLRNGSEVLCTHQETVGDRIRLYLNTPRDAGSNDGNYVEIAADSVLRIEDVPDSAVQVGGAHDSSASRISPAALTEASTRDLLTRAGQIHNIDADLLASVIHAESGGNPRAVSRAGARGLMQLMPATAASLGVQDAFAPEQNIAGGTAYFDQLLTRYHDNIALALAAYNAGPEAVDRYHGIPPYAETQAYVARIIREYNRRKIAARAAQTTGLH